MGFKQYIPSKHHQFCVKIFVLCNDGSDYIHYFIIYIGTETEIHCDEAFGISGSVVKTSLSGLIGKGHILYRDNWYCSPTLLFFT